MSQAYWTIFASHNEEHEPSSTVLLACHSFYLECSFLIPPCSYTLFWTQLPWWQLICLPLSLCCQHPVQCLASGELFIHKSYINHSWSYSWSSGRGLAFLFWILCTIWFTILPCTLDKKILELFLNPSPFINAIIFIDWFPWMWDYSMIWLLSVPWDRPRPERENCLVQSPLRECLIVIDVHSNI